jgi:hypothetical protein
MKLPSIQYLAQSAGQAFIRFPFSIISAFIGVCAGITLIEGEDHFANYFPWLNLMLTGGLGIGLFFCVDVFSYNQGYTRAKRLLFDLGAFLLLVLIYFTLPDQDSTLNTSVPYIRYTIYGLVIHLVVAFIPFINKGQINGFWNYNRLLFVRFLTSALYSGVLYGGLALALGSLDFLFDVDLHDELFGDMFAVIGGLFNTWFFLAGIPDTFHDLDDVRTYPKSIRVFSQYILLPLLILYLVILYIYGGKIIVMWSWPKGIVSYLITCVGVLGILTLLLLYPYGNEPGNTWMKKFGRWYYIVLIPLVGLLFYAIIVRMSDYGITINRYIVILLGIWLTIVSVYFIVGKTNIKFIPVSLAIMMLLVSFGPWGMFSVSERSQVKRLRTILEESKILVDGKIKNEVLWNPDSIPKLLPLNKEDLNDEVLVDSLHNEVYSIIDYLDDHHGFSAVRDWYTQDIDSILKVSNEKNDRWSRLHERNVYMRTLGLADEMKYESDYEGFYYSSDADRYDRAIPVQGFDYYISRNFSWPHYGEGRFIFEVDDGEFATRIGPTLKNLFTLTSAKDTIVFNCEREIKNLLAKHGRAAASVKFKPIVGTRLSGQLDVQFRISSIGFDVRDSVVYVENVSGYLLLKDTK